MQDKWYIEVKAFGGSVKRFSVRKYGHAAAVADAIRWLAGGPIQAAIETDHTYDEAGMAPTAGHGRPAATRAKG